MSAATLTPPAAGPVTPAPAPIAPPSPAPAAGPPLYLDRLYRYTVEQYHAMIAAGVLTSDTKCELIEGYLVTKMPQDPPHGGSVKALNRLLGRLLPDGWTLSIQSPITLGDGEPEPDVAVVRGGDRTFFARHPGPADFGVVIEVADSSLAIDRRDKGRTYARAELPVYWVVNLVDGQVEVYTQPQAAADPPAYAGRQDYKPGETVPLTLDGATVAVPVAELLP